MFNYDFLTVQWLTPTDFHQTIKKEQTVANPNRGRMAMDSIFPWFATPKKITR